MTLPINPSAPLAPQSAIRIFADWNDGALRNSLNTETSHRIQNHNNDTLCRVVWKLPTKDYAVRCYIVIPPAEATHRLPQLWRGGRGGVWFCDRSVNVGTRESILAAINGNSPGPAHMLDAGMPFTLDDIAVDGRLSIHIPGTDTLRFI